MMFERKLSSSYFSIDSLRSFLSAFSPFQFLEVMLVRIFHITTAFLFFCYDIFSFSVSCTPTASGEHFVLFFSSSFPFVRRVVIICQEVEWISKGAKDDRKRLRLQLSAALWVEQLQEDVWRRSGKASTFYKPLTLRPPAGRLSIIELIIKTLGKTLLLTMHEFSHPYQ